MSKFLKIFSEDILYQIKLSCQMPGILESIAIRIIINDVAIRNNIKIELEELQQAADDLRLYHNLIRAEDTWLWLEKNYLSIHDFEELAKFNLLCTKVANFLFADKVETFFIENQLEYTGAITYELLLDDEDLAWEVFDVLQKNEVPFQNIARQYIKEPELRCTGGYCSIRYPKDFQAEVAASVFAANPPQILKPIVTQQGVYLIRVEEILHPELNEHLRFQVLRDLFSNWLQQQLEEISLVAHLDRDTSLTSPQHLVKPA